jgi:hypothetical protein
MLKKYPLKTLPPEVTAVQFYRDEPPFPGLMYFGPEATDGHRVWAFFWANGDTSREENAVDISEEDWIIFENGRPQRRMKDETFRTLYALEAGKDVTL